MHNKLNHPAIRAFIERSKAGGFNITAALSEDGHVVATLDSMSLNRRADVALASLASMGRIRAPWIRGMRAALIDSSHLPVPDERRGPAARAPRSEGPDTSDPLTVQGLALLAREAWGDNGSHLAWDDEAMLGRGWQFRVPSLGADAVVADGHGEAEVVVAALEAAARST